MKLCFPSCGAVSGLLICAVLLSGGQAEADTVILKSGEKFEGKTLKEDASTVTLEVQVSPRLKDEKTFARRDIAQHVKTTVGQEEIQKVRKLVANTDGLTRQEYDALIAQVQEVRIRHADNPTVVKETEGVLATLKAEQAKVNAKWYKIDGEWLNPESQGGDILIAKNRGLVKSKLAGPDDMKLFFLKEARALLWFESELRDVPKDLKYGAGVSAQYFKAVNDAIAILDQYGRRLREMEKQQPALTARRSVATGDEKTKLDNQSSAFVNIPRPVPSVEADLVQQWLIPVYAYDLPSIQAALKKVTENRERLTEILRNRPAAKN